ncbi:hypothetical protein [Amycolatopsis samaneae]|uniref:ABC transporter permease n=1 Tax=Amycolatopsis samaneae TaxID=664691 RepID=A0ABW5GSN5_9PSEU
MTPATSPVGRGVGAGLLWATWRQHRWLLVLTTAAVLAVSGTALWLCAEAGPGPVSEAQLRFLRTVTDGLLYAVTGFAGFAATFWGAPLVAREFEQRTQLWAWSQDVPAGRWLAVKVLVFGLVLAVLAALLGAVTMTLTHRLHGQDPFGYPPFASVAFELWPPLQVAYALFGLALGVATSVLTRRTLAAMGAALAGFVAVRLVIAVLARPHYLPPVRNVRPQDDPSPMIGADSLHEVLVVGRGGWMNTTGELAPLGGDELPQPIHDCLFGGSGRLTACLAEHGWTRSYLDYQPADRLLTFRLVETGVFLLLAAALYLLARQRVRALSGHRRRTVA